MISDLKLLRSLFMLELKFEFFDNPSYKGGLISEGILFWLWSHCQKKVPNLAPEQKV